MTEADFDFLRAFLKTHSGLALVPEKRYLVDSRLTPLCRRFNLASLSEMVAKMRSSRDATIEKAVIDAMTTNETFFFRDRTPFDLFKDTLLPRFTEARAKTKKLRIWCAASSTGQEPYSLAMLVDQAGLKQSGWTVNIIATDLSAEVLEKAKAGLYSQFEVQRGLPVNLLLKYFTQVGDVWQISPAIRAMVDFRPLNLIKPFAELGTFDIVYCRNVLIYFDTPTKADVLKRICNQMSDDAVMLLGAAETVIGLTDTLGADPKTRGLYVRHPATAVRKLAIA